MVVGGGGGRGGGGEEGGGSVSNSTRTSYSGPKARAMNTIARVRVLIISLISPVLQKCADFPNMPRSRVTLLALIA